MINAEQLAHLLRTPPYKEPAEHQKQNIHGSTTHYNFLCRTYKRCYRALMWKRATVDCMVASYRLVLPQHSHAQSQPSKLKRLTEHSKTNLVWTFVCLFESKLGRELFAEEAVGVD